jgi:hypothetical protein
VSQKSAENRKKVSLACSLLLVLMIAGAGYWEWKKSVKGKL